MSDLIQKSAKELNELFVKKEASAKEIAEAHLKQIDETEPKIQALTNVTKELAIKQAEELDAKNAKGEKFGPMAGVPIIVKDVLCIKGLQNTCGSKMLEPFIAPYESTATKKLWESGAICLAKANMDEFAMGSSTENSAYKKTKNPWDLNKVPGGSSGGSAAAVAAYQAPVSLGTDTGGSVRQPGSFCGTVSLKPTYGRVSRFGLVAFASSLDQIGPFSRSVYDSALVLQHISGHDPKDSTSIDVDVDSYINLKPENVKGKKIGIIKELYSDDFDKEIKDTLDDSIKALKELGAEIKEISLKYIMYSAPVYYILATAEASSNLARYDGVKYGIRSTGAPELMSMYTNTRQEGFGDEVKRRIMLGTYALSSGYYDAYYKKAQQVRRLVTQDFLNAFEDVDLLISPTAPTTAFDIGSKIEDPLSMYLADIATIPASLAGLPAMSLPCGRDSNKLPIGIQLIAPSLSEKLLLDVASALESKVSSKFNENKPAILA